MTPAQLFISLLVVIAWSQIAFWAGTKNDQPADFIPTGLYVCVTGVMLLALIVVTFALLEAAWSLPFPK